MQGEGAFQANVWTRLGCGAGDRRFKVPEQEFKVPSAPTDTSRCGPALLSPTGYYAAPLLRDAVASFR